MQNIRNIRSNRLIVVFFI